MKILVTGAGGFIGHHLVKALRGGGHAVFGVDTKLPEYEESPASSFFLRDLRSREETRRIFDHVTFSTGSSRLDRIYHLAADMGGIGFIEGNKADIVANNTRIDLNVFEAAAEHGAGRILYTSSACVYPVDMQGSVTARRLTEADAYPANPEDGYGWEKLYAERMLRHMSEDRGLDARTVRFHNIYGPLGAYDGGREKSPAAICRKVALADDGEDIEVWGDGEQVRSYCYVDDCIDGIIRIMEQAAHRGPVNLGTDRAISVNQLIDLVAGIAGKKIGRRYDLRKPQGVRGRNSDNGLLRKIVGWEPQTPLEEGIRRTYEWIEKMVQGRGRRRA